MCSVSAFPEHLESILTPREITNFVWASTENGKLSGNSYWENLFDSQNNTFHYSNVLCCAGKNIQKEKNLQRPLMSVIRAKIMIN